MVAQVGATQVGGGETTYEPTTRLARWSQISLRLCHGTVEISITLILKINMHACLTYGR